LILRFFFKKNQNQWTFDFGFFFQRTKISNFWFWGFFFKKPKSMNLLILGFFFQPTKINDFSLLSFLFKESKSTILWFLFYFFQSTKIKILLILQYSKNPSQQFFKNSKKPPNTGSNHQQFKIRNVPMKFSRNELTDSFVHNNKNPWTFPKMLT
jgi:hypothetical protein